MIVRKRGAAGLRRVIGLAGPRLVLLVVVAQVRRGLPMLVRTIVGDRRPGDLERQQAEQNEGKPAAHGRGV